MSIPQTMQSNQTKQTLGAPTQESAKQTFAPIETNKRIGNKTIRPMGTTSGSINSLMQSTPSQQTVNKSTDTVSGQMDTLLNKNSDYMKYAQRTAMETANRRGLLNSSIAAGAGVDAAMRSALPIAQQDAQTYNSANTNNTNWDNKFSENKQTAGLGMLRDKSQAGYMKDLEQQKYQHNKGLLSQEGRQRLDQMGAQSGYNKDEMSLKNQFDSELQKLRQQHESGMLDTQGQQRLEQMEKQSAYNKDESAFSSGLKLTEMAAQSGLNINELAAKSGFNIAEMTEQQKFNVVLQGMREKHEAGMLDTKGLQTLDQMEKQSGYNITEANNQGELNKDLENLRSQNQSGLLTQEGQQRLEQMEAQQTDNLEMENLRNEGQSGLLTQEGEQRLEQLEAQATITSTRDTVLQSFDMEKLDTQQQNTVTNQAAQFAETAKRDQQQIDAKFTSQYLESNSSLQNAWSQEVSSVYSNPNMTPQQQSKAINEIKARYNGLMASNLATYQSMEGVNVNSSIFESEASSGGATVTGGGATTGGGLPINEGGSTGGGAGAGDGLDLTNN